MLNRHFPKWFVFLIDITISVLSMTFAYLLRLSFTIEERYVKDLMLVIPLTLLIRGGSFLIARTHTGVVRYISTKDAERLFLTVLIGSIIFALLNLIRFHLIDGLYLIPRSVVGIDFFIAIFLLSGYRIMAKILFESNAQLAVNYQKIIIYGDESFALVTKHALERENNQSNKIVAFLFDGIKNSGKKIDGIPVYGIEDLNEILNKFSPERLIIAKSNVYTDKKNEIAELCLNKNIRLLTVPSVDKWINGELSLNQIRNVRIEDLLERNPIKLSETSIKKEVLNKTVLVTGAAGSIGSELVRQLTRFNPKKIILLDQAESPLYDIELELNEKLNFYNFEIYIGSIVNLARTEFIFKSTQPCVVYHAAAYKHVPMMENNPSEAVNNNVIGTINIAELSEKYKVKKFVMVSTDKAVNPTNIMGASKRLAEIYIQSKNKLSQTQYITTRFGNVLGSNGSVIPRFRRQIEKGGPVTVTHHEVTRYFMTIPEACQLVLEAGAMGQGGEIYVFDMGRAVKIVDLAKKMIKLSGLKLGRDIQIQFTGLRPGEKLFEELLNTKENTLATHHSQIMIGRVRKYDFKEIREKYLKFIPLIEENKDWEIVKLMKAVIPEFISENSKFAELDSESTS